MKQRPNGVPAQLTTPTTATCLPIDDTDDYRLPPRDDADGGHDSSKRALSIRRWRYFWSSRHPDPDGSSSRKPRPSSRSLVSATLPQIGSRVFFTWGILWSFPEGVGAHGCRGRVDQDGTRRRAAA